jgi:AcrR family transcriptional regulator
LPLVARAGLTPGRIVDEAGALADEVGLSQLSFAALAARLGVKVPSLYKHVTGLDAVRQAMSVTAKSELAEQLARAASGRARHDALHALADAYRGWAAEHPGRYESTLRAPLPDDPADVAASGRAIEVIFDALRGYGLAEDRLVDTTRMLRASLHGFVALEAAGGFALPVDVDRSFTRMVSAIAGSIAGSLDG